MADSGVAAMPCGWGQMIPCGFRRVPHHSIFHNTPELEAHGALHDATLRTIEDAEEWQDYDAHVSFELAALRHRYVSTDTPMTPARRAQMQAHLRQKQREVMETHASRVATQFLTA